MMSERDSQRIPTICPIPLASQRLVRAQHLLFYDLLICLVECFSLRSFLKGKLSAVLREQWTENQEPHTLALNK